MIRSSKYVRSDLGEMQYIASFKLATGFSCQFSQLKVYIVSRLTPPTNVFISVSGLILSCNKAHTISQRMQASCMLKYSSLCWN